MVRTRSMATSPSHQESGNASSHPNHDRQSADHATVFHTTSAINGSRHGKINTSEPRVNQGDYSKDQMRKAMDEMRENIRRAKPIDDLVH